MWPDRVSNPGPLTCKSGALPIELCGPAKFVCSTVCLIQEVIDSTLKEICKWVINVTEMTAYKRSLKTRLICKESIFY